MEVVLMKGMQPSVEQSVRVFKQAELGVPVVQTDPQGGDQRVDVLPVDEAVRGTGEQPGPAAEAVGG
jgi:hypothetical protein